MLTQLNGIDGVTSSSALLADNGNRIVQIRIQPGRQATKVLEKARSVLRAEIPDKTPVQLETKSVAAVGLKQDWLTIGQLNELTTMEESSPPRFDKSYWLLALAVFLALGAFLYWLLRRKRTVRQGDAGIVPL